MGDLWRGIALGVWTERPSSFRGAAGTLHALGECPSRERASAHVQIAYSENSPCQMSSA